MQIVKGNAVGKEYDYECYIFSDGNVGGRPPGGGGYYIDIYMYIYLYNIDIYMYIYLYNTKFEILRARKNQDLSVCVSRKGVHLNISLQFLLGIGNKSRYR